MRAIIIISFFMIIFGAHLLYFKLSADTCAGGFWLERYLREQEYFIGISYGLSFAFVAFAFLKFKEKRRNALKSAFGGGLLSVLIWFACFLFGCCGSPMPIIFLNLIGLSNLKLHKIILFLMTVIFLALGHLWLNKKSRQNCCNDTLCKQGKR